MVVGQVEGGLAPRVHTRAPGSHCDTVLNPDVSWVQCVSIQRLPFYLLQRIDSSHFPVQEKKHRKGVWDLTAS